MGSSPTFGTKTHSFANGFFHSERRVGPDDSFYECLDADRKRQHSIPTRGTDKPQKGGNASEFQNEARFFFEAMRRVSFCGFQNDRFWEDFR